MDEADPCAQLAAQAHRLRARALRLLAQREHSRSELARKLAHAARDPAPPEALLERVLDDLQAQGLLDDRRFAASLARRLLPRHGAQRVMLELRRHAIDPACIARAVQEAQCGLPDEVERARQMLQRQHARPDADAAERARWMRFLQRRGFDSEAALRALRALRVEAGTTQACEAIRGDD